MGLLKAIFEQRRLMLSEHPSDVSNKLAAFWGGRPSASGVTVTQDSALTLSAFYACVRVLAEDTASLPLHLYRRLSRGKERATNHPLYRVLHTAPNPEQTSYEFREAMIGQCVMTGDAYAEIENNNGGQVIGLWPLRADKMNPQRVNGVIVYDYTLPSGQVVRLGASQILHLRGFGNGIRGYSLLRAAGESIGLALAIQESSARLFSNGTRLSGLLQHPGKLGDAASKNLLASWNAMYSGLNNAHRTAILEEGVKWQQIGIAPEDAQMIESRRFQIEDFARFSRVSPHKIMDYSRATFSNIEETNIDHVVSTLRPWLVRFEQRANQSLLTPTEQKDFFFEHLVDGMLRGNVISRNQSYAVARQNGWMSANDIRELENMNPLPGDEGDIYLVPLNMVPASQLTDMSGTRSACQCGHEHRTENEDRVQPDKRIEYRAKADNRRRLAKAHVRAFADAARRSLKREGRDIMVQAKKMLTQRGLEDFTRWLDQYYADNTAYIGDNIRPIMHSYAATIWQAASQEVGKEPESDLELDRFMTDYLRSYVTRHKNSSIGQVQKALRDAASDKQLEALQEELDSWIEDRSEQIAQRETIQVGSAVAKLLFVGVGILALRWVTFGKTCPYCDSLDGKTTNIKDTFIGKEYQPSGADSVLRNDTPIGHPPIHGGCDCQIVPA